MNDLEWAIINLVTHDRGIEFSDRSFFIMPLQFGKQILRPGEMDAKSTARPKKRFAQAFNEEKVLFRLRVPFRQQFRCVPRNGAIAPLKSEVNPERRSAFSSLVAETTIRKDGWPKLRIE